MKRSRAIPFILIGSALHVALGFSVIGTYLKCDIQPNCVPPITKVLTGILGFPLNLVSWMWSESDGSISNLSFALFFLNSVLAVTFIWFVFKAFLRLGENMSRTKGGEVKRD